MTPRGEMTDRAIECADKYDWWSEHDKWQAVEIAQNKDRQLKYILKAFYEWAYNRGMCDTIAEFDLEHQVETFISDILPQKMKQ